jgi:SHS2 domain-containing protein
VNGSNAAGARHSFEEHTGEVRLELTAPSPEELFAEAGRALAELMLGEIREPAASAPAHVVEVRAPDRAALLVEWLNELIFLSETSKQVFTNFRMEYVDETAARAVVTGLAPETLKTAVKAATLHGVSVEGRQGSWGASVVLDV